MTKKELLPLKTFGGLFLTIRQRFSFFIYYYFPFDILCYQLIRKLDQIIRCSFLATTDITTHSSWSPILFLWYRVLHLITPEQRQSDNGALLKTRSPLMFDYDPRLCIHNGIRIEYAFFFCRYRLNQIMFAFYIWTHLLFKHWILIEYVFILLLKIFFDCGSYEMLKY